MHPFAKYIQTLGKDRNGMRHLTREEAYQAMRMIACYDVEDSYGEVVVTGTLALTIRALDIESQPNDAQTLALSWWRERHQQDLVRRRSDG
jgi:hypothetical protein